MAEPTLSVDYMTLVRELARQLGFGYTYSTGTVTSSGTTLTLTGGTWPSWVGTTTAASGAAAINLAGTFYEITQRTSDTVVELDSDPSASSLAYVVVQSRSNTKQETFQVIQDKIDEGYRELCFPAPMDGNPEQFFVWTWLLKQDSITLVNNDYDYALDDDFGQHVDNSFTYAKGNPEQTLTLISQKEFRGKQSRDDATGVPYNVSWRETAFDSSVGRRFELLVYPTPVTGAGAGDVIEFLTRIVPDQLTPTNRYPLCGAAHGDTLLKCCQAAAERWLKDEAGVYAQKYQERLAASMLADAAKKSQIGV